jgi:predicted nucleic acid-binding protein
MIVLVDTTIWVDYFRGTNRSGHLDLLLEENLVVTNELILAELLPPLKVKKEHELIKLLSAVQKLVLEIDWDEIIEYQFNLLKKGINGVGISDLIIFQNSIKNNCPVYSNDSHFIELCKAFNGQLIHD